MNVDFFLKFSQFRIGSVYTAEDYVDKFNYQLTSSLLVLFVATISFRQYIFTSIQCWIPHEWARSWEEFSENYCWIEGTYFAHRSTGPPPAIEDRHERDLGYYQWVPFVLAGQSGCFFLPHLIWLVVSCRIGRDVNQMIRFGLEASTIDQRRREKVIRHLSCELGHILRTRCPDIHASGGIWQKLKRPLVKRHSPLLAFGKRSGHLLALMYLGMKLLYLFNGILQLYMIKKFLRTDSILFGIDFLRSLAKGQTWELSGVFPRVTWCDVQVRDIANKNRFTMMCVLPLNMLNEKIYIFLWFWLVLCVILTAASTISWIARLSVRHRNTYVKKYLRLLEQYRPSCPDECQCVKIFTEQYLKSDGIFILWMISRNVGELVAAEVLAGVWQQWLREREQYRELLTRLELQDSIHVSEDEKESMLYKSRSHSRSQSNVSYGKN